jgi:hypothetical protein
MKDVCAPAHKHDSKIYAGRGNMGREATTRIVRLGVGTISTGGLTVSCTKTLMFPYTGRRHQLRLHSGVVCVLSTTIPRMVHVCSHFHSLHGISSPLPRSLAPQATYEHLVTALVGYPILGDWTYGHRSLAESLPRQQPRHCPPPPPCCLLLLHAPLIDFGLVFGRKERNCSTSPEPARRPC